MPASVSNRLRAIFLAYSIFAFVLGLLYLVVPERWGEMVDWVPAQPFDHRVIGAAFLAFGLGAWLARRESDWERVRVVVQMNMFWCLLAALLMAGGLLGGGMPTLGWVYVVAVGGFAVAFILSFFEHTRA